MQPINPRDKLSKNTPIKCDNFGGNLINGIIKHAKTKLTPLIP